MHVGRSAEWAFLVDLGAECCVLFYPSCRNTAIIHRKADRILGLLIKSPRYLFGR